MQMTLAELAAKIQGTVVGDSTQVVTILSPINDIQPGSLVFAEGDENLKRAMQSAAGVLLVHRSVSSDVKPVIQVDHPFKAFIQLLPLFYPPIAPPIGIHPTATLAADVEIGADVSIGPFVSVGAGSRLGRGCVLKSHVSVGANVTLGDEVCLHPQVVIYNGCHLGNRVTIHAGAVIGSDGFGYTYIDEQHLKVPHVGIVRIEDDVEIGANTAIDRATLGATVIGQGTKIDNLVQIAHSVQLGPQNMVCGFTGIAGSTVSGKGVVFAANVGVSDHVRIDDGVVLGARTGVPPRKHLKQGNVYLGNPARPREKALELELSATRIPYLRQQLQVLREKMDKLYAKVFEEDIEAPK